LSGKIVILCTVQQTSRKQVKLPPGAFSYLKKYSMYKSRVMEADIQQLITSKRFILLCNSSLKFSLISLFWHRQSKNCVIRPCKNRKHEFIRIFLVHLSYLVKYLNIISSFFYEFVCPFNQNLTDWMERNMIKNQSGLIFTNKKKTWSFTY
jgi:hypothetical protein